jgi:hypothetical protein
MPKKDSMSIVYISPPDEPYFNRLVDVRPSSGLEPVRFDVALHRGAWITGRVTDKETGEGVRVYIEYIPYLDNPHADAIERFNKESGSRGYEFNWSEQDRHDVMFPDGDFRVLGLPGHGLLGVRAISSIEYIRGVGADSLHGVRGDEEVARAHTGVSPELNNVTREIWHDSESESATYDFQLDRVP